MVIEGEPTVEFVRVWAWEVSRYERRGWRHDSAKSCPSTTIFGSGHIDVLLVRVPESRPILPEPWLAVWERLMADA